MTRLFLLNLALWLAACTPVPDDNPDNVVVAPSPECGLLGCRSSKPGRLPGRGTEIDRLASNCQRPMYCGAVGYVDCGSAVDGPAYYFDAASGEVTGYCGGYCMADPGGNCERTCPPPEWNCSY